MRKIKLLFVIYYLGSGGAEKALINLLDMIDYSQYRVDLLLFKQEGLYLNQLNPNVNVLPELKEFSRISSSKKFIRYSLSQGNILDAVKRAYYYIKQNHLHQNVEEELWHLCWSKHLPEISGDYDVAAGYIQGLPLYYVAECIKARIKLGWIHHYYTTLDINKKFDQIFFKKLDYLISVSDECTQCLNEEFPDLHHPAVTLHNLMSPNIIINKANETLSFADHGEQYRLLTIGRLVPQKGYDWAIKATELLVKQGLNLCWYVIGVGPLLNELQKQVADSHLQNHFVFMGEHSNPYPYLKQCDIYIQPSRHEGKSIAIDEAKILHKLIIATDFPAVNDQLTHEKNSLIVNMDPASIAAAIKRLLTDSEICQTLSDNLKQENLAQYYLDLQKHYDLFNRSKQQD